MMYNFDENRTGEKNMKKIVIVMVLLLGLVACGGNKEADSPKMYMYGEEGNFKIYSPVELTESIIDVKNQEYIYYTEDESTTLGFYLYSVNVNFEILYARELSMYEEYGFDEIVEERIEKDGIHFYVISGYSEMEDTMYIGILFLDSQNIAYSIDFYSTAENAKVYLEKFEDEFEFTEIDLADYWEEEYQSVIGGTQTIGNNEQGYVDIPESWMKYNVEGGSPIQYGYSPNISYANLMTMSAEDSEYIDIDYLMESLKEYEAENTITFERDDIVIGDYELNIFTQYYLMDECVLTVVVFYRHDGKLQYLSIEGPIWDINYLEELVFSSYIETK